MEVEQTAGREPGFMATTLLWPRVLARIFDESRWEDVGAKQAPMLTNRTIDVAHARKREFQVPPPPTVSSRFPGDRGIQLSPWRVSRFQ